MNLESTMSKSDELPLAYRWLLANKLHSFYPWYLLRNNMEAEALRKQYVRQASSRRGVPRDMLPFARRDDNNAIAGFAISNRRITDKVVVTELYWSTRTDEETSELKLTTYTSLWEWLSDEAISTSREWASEELMREIKMDA